MTSAMAWMAGQVTALPEPSPRRADMGELGQFTASLREAIHAHGAAVSAAELQGLTGVPSRLVRGLLKADINAGTIVVQPLNSGRRMAYAPGVPLKILAAVELLEAHGYRVIVPATPQN